MTTSAVVLSDLHLGAPDSLLAPKAMDASVYQATLDYFLVSSALLPRLKKAFISDKVLGADHCPVGIEIEI